MHTGGRGVYMRRMRLPYPEKIPVRRSLGAKARDLVEKAYEQSPVSLRCLRLYLPFEALATVALYSQAHR